MVHTPTQWYNIRGGRHESRFRNIQEEAVVIHGRLLHLVATPHSKSMQTSRYWRWRRARF